MTPKISFCRKLFQKEKDNRFPDLNSIFLVDFVQNWMPSLTIVKCSSLHLFTKQPLLSPVYYYCCYCWIPSVTIVTRNVQPLHLFKLNKHLIHFYLVFEWSEVLVYVFLLYKSNIFCCKVISVAKCLINKIYKNILSKINIS